MMDSMAAQIVVFLGVGLVMGWEWRVKNFNMPCEVSLIGIDGIVSPGMEILTIS